MKKRNKNGEKPIIFILYYIHKEFIIMSLVTIGLLGVIIGYILGCFFSVRNEVDVHVNLGDIEQALNNVIGEDESEFVDAEHIRDRLARFFKKDTPNFKFYRVNMPMLVYAPSPEKAFALAKFGLKKQKGFMFKTGAIDVRNVYLEEITEEEVNHAFDILEEDYDDEEDLDENCEET